MGGGGRESGRRGEKEGGYGRGENDVVVSAGRERTEGVVRGGIGKIGMGRDKNDEGRGRRDKGEEGDGGIWMGLGGIEEKSGWWCVR